MARLGIVAVGQRGEGATGGRWRNDLLAFLLTLSVVNRCDAWPAACSQSATGASARLLTECRNGSRSTSLLFASIEAHSTQVHRIRCWGTCPVPCKAPRLQPALSHIVSSLHVAACLPTRSTRSPRGASARFPLQRGVLQPGASQTAPLRTGWLDTLTCPTPDATIPAQVAGSDAPPTRGAASTGCMEIGWTAWQ